MSLAPPEPLAGGSRFWENLSLESLEEASLALLLGREATPATAAEAPLAGPPSATTNAAGRTSSTSSRHQRPTSIALPSPPRIPAAAKPASPLSPKLYSWNFLRRAGGSAAAAAAPTTPASSSSSGKTGSSGVPPNRTIEIASAPPRKHRSSLTLPEHTTFDLEEARLVQGGDEDVSASAAGAGAGPSGDASAASAPATASSSALPDRPQRPGPSRSSTWTDSLPTVRTLALSQEPSAPTALRMTPSSSASSSSRGVDPFGATEDPVLLVPIVAPRKDNLARGGRFGLFRRGSLSPRVEKTGFTIGGRPSGSDESSAKERSRKSSKESGLDKFDKSSKRRHRGSFGSLASLGGQQRSSSPVSWGPRAEEMRHVALTTASPPPEGVDYEPASPSSDAASIRSYFPIAGPSAGDAQGRQSSLPRSSLHASADLHQLAHPPACGTVLSPPAMSCSPVNQSPLRQSIDDSDLPRPHITFGAQPAPASPLRTSAPTFPPSHSESSLSLQTSDSDEDFPARFGARKAVKSHRLRKPQVKIGNQRDRSVSPLRYASDGEAFDSQGEDGARGRLKAWQWWKPAGPSGASLPSGAIGGRPSSVALTPAPSTDRPPKRGKSTSSKIPQRGFKVTSRPISSFEPSAARPTADFGFPPTPPTTTAPTPVAGRSLAGTREPSPSANDSLLTASRPAAFIRQTTVMPSGNVSVRTSAALREWQPPTKAAPRPPNADHRALPPVNTTSASGALAPTARKDSLSPPSASSCEAPSPLSAYGTATEGDEATTNSEHELATTEDGSYRFAGHNSHHNWQPRVQTAGSERSWDGDSILHRVESRLGGPPATKV